MKQRYLEVTFRNGKPLAAYLYLPRAAGATTAVTRDFGDGLKVDYDDDGTAIGIEITAPTKVSAARVNTVLEQLGVSTLGAGELAPLAA